MGSVIRAVEIGIPIDKAWSLLRDFGAAADLFPDVLSGCEVSGDTRTVTFRNGATVVERLVTVDDQHHRVAYAVVGGDFTHHSASMRLTPSGEGVAFTWESDVLPDDRAARIMPLVEAGCASIKRSLESRAGAGA